MHLRVATFLDRGGPPPLFTLRQDLHAYHVSVMKQRLFLAFSLLMALAGCQTAYYATMEKFGYEKRDLLKRAVEAARGEQKEAQVEFKDALTRLKALYVFQGGDLERKYNQLKSDFDSCETQAKDVKKRIKDMDEVANDLFAEWEKEIGQISNASMASNSRTKLSETRSRYQQLVATLQQSEASMDPILRSFKDHVLYLKHNLNAAAIGSLKGEATNIQNDIERLILQMNGSIAEADAFIKTLN